MCKRGRYLVVDETKVHNKSEWVYVFAAVNPENHEVVSMLANAYRESIDELGFLKRRLCFYKGKPSIATDGGP